MVTFCRGFVCGAAPKVLCPPVGTIALIACGLLSASQAAAQSSSPAPVTILQNNGSLANGYIFIGPMGVNVMNPVQGPAIIDNQGRVVWFAPSPNSLDAADF